RDRLVTACDATVLGAAGLRVDRARDAVVAGRWTVPVAGLAALDDPVAAGRRTIVVVRVVAHCRAAAVSVLALGDRLVLAGDVAFLLAAGRLVDRARVPVAARGGAVPIARLARFDDAVAAARRAIGVVLARAAFGAAAVAALALRDGRVIARDVACL